MYRGIGDMSCRLVGNNKSEPDQKKVLKTIESRTHFGTVPPVDNTTWLLQVIIKKGTCKVEKVMVNMNCKTFDRGG